ncbi:toxin-antitoxin system HicB family antitoxin [Candidatus Saccharibacteria bacterium]|nr:toxin-antitoxin system HicB family antitoxin [Candidatus Saccharibacteria bacterium]
MRPKSDKKMLSIRLSEALTKKVKEQAIAKGITVTAWIEQAIRSAL